MVFRESNQTIKTKHYLKEDMLSKGAPVGMAIEEDPIYKENILKFKVKKPLNKNSMLYLTRSLALNHEASDIIKNVKIPSIPMDLKVSLDGNMAVELEGRFQGLDGHKHCLTVISDFKMENAINKPLTADKIIDQLNKTGKTNFMIGKLDIDIPETLFTPISNLNKVRRDFFEAAEAELIKTFKPGKNEVLRVKNRIKENMQQSTGSPSKFVSNHSCVLGSILRFCRRFEGCIGRWS